MRYLLYSIFLCTLFTICSCTKYTTLVNYDEAPKFPSEPQAISNYKPIKIQANDILQIRIAAQDMVVVQPFTFSGSEDGVNEYLVDGDGFIDFPTIGKIEVRGLEIEEIKTKISGLLKPYFQQLPIVQLRLTNFKVNVNGEVRRPGSFTIPNSRVTLIDAITYAGDFTSYSSRDSILIIRERDGMRSFGYVNFNSPDVFNSEYFYMQQNDVVYVKPNKGIINSVRDPSSRFLPWLSGAVSLVALILSIRRI